MLVDEAALLGIVPSRHLDAAEIPLALVVRMQQVTAGCSALDAAAASLQAAAGQLSAALPSEGDTEAAAAASGLDGAAILAACSAALYAVVYAVDSVRAALAGASFAAMRLADGESACDTPSSAPTSAAASGGRGYRSRRGG